MHGEQQGSAVKRWLPRYDWLFPSLTYLIVAGIVAAFISSYAENPKFRLDTWDAGWYKSIITRGYQFNGNYSEKANIAFFPLHPLAAKDFAQLAAVSSTSISALMVTMSFFYNLLTMNILWRILRNFLPLKLSVLSYILFLTAPFSMFLYTGYSEALYLLLSVLSLYLLLVRKHFFLASAVIGIASAARFSAIPTLGGVYIFAAGRSYLNTYGLRLRCKTKEFRRILYTGFCLSGALLYGAYLFHRFGNALAFIDIQQAWYEKQMPYELSNLIELFRFTEQWNAFSEQWPGWKNLLAVKASRINPQWYTAFIFFANLPLLFLTRKKLPPALLLYCIFTQAFYYYATHSNALGSMSMGRYLMPLFPVQVAIAIVLTAWSSMLANSLEKAFRKFRPLSGKEQRTITLAAFSVLLTYLLAYRFILFRKFLRWYFFGIWVS